MPSLSVEVPHSMGKTEAVELIKSKIEENKDSFLAGDDTKHEWDGDTVAFEHEAMGMKVSGTLAVEDSGVKIDAKLPMAAMMFKGVIEQKVREELTKLLSS